VSRRPCRWRCRAAGRCSPRKSISSPVRRRSARADRVGAGFFETVGIPLRRGRTFTDRDERDDARVLIVNETLAAQVWPAENPVGRTVDLDAERWQVIGVVGDIRSC